MSESRRARARAALSNARRFAWSMLGVDLWGEQVAIADSLRTHDRVSVRACTASGKTFLAAVLTLQWAVLNKNGIVITTATTWPQVERQLWSEIRKLIARARMMKRLLLPEPSRTMLEVAPGRYAIGLSPKAEESIGGFHEGNVLVIVDEASGVRGAVHAGIEGLLSGGNARLLELGNPLWSGGDFAKHHNEVNSGYRCHRISAFDTPNFAWLGGRDVPIADKIERLLLTPDDEIARHITHPALINPRWVKGRARVWRRDHPSWQARIEAEFPTLSDRALVPLLWAHDAADISDEDRVRRPDEHVYIGIDVAGPGKNETVCTAWCGGRLLDMFVTEEPDPRGSVVAWLRKWGAHIGAIAVDSNGIGYNFALHLQDLELPVLMVNVGKASSDPERFVNLRAEVFWSLRERFERRELRGVADEKMVAQLTSLEWGTDPKGRILLKPKKDLDESPDRADSAALGSWAEVTGGFMDDGLDYAGGDSHTAGIGRLSE